MNKRILPLLLAASFSAAIAAPTAPVVVNGQATFAQQGNVFSITNTPNTIINWQSFNIAPGEITRFLQQNADSAVLNRITGQDPSQILGALQSNGHVFLINPNGIMFGKDARVDVNGLTASTLNISNADFIAGKRNFTSGGAAGTISNQGSITTPAGGQVFLIASSVENSGIITSPRGQVVLAAGHTVQLVDSGNPDLHVVVSAPADKAINLGQVIAQGGRVGIYGALINQRGVVNANSAVVGANGKIVLKASGDTLLEQGSVTTATGAGEGGDIHLLGKRVGLTGNAQVDASGAAGGGTVLVGGDYQGRNAATLAHAQQTWLGQGASIKADATHRGNGGKVVLWSDTATSAFGSISARGGANGGNGGLVETSGAALNVAGLRVNTLAARGQRGSWLLDPLDITVDATGSVTLDDVALFSINDTAPVTIAAALLSGATTDVNLQAKHDIAFEAPVSMSGHSLIARAGHDIRVNAPISVTGGSISMTAADTGAGVSIDGGAVAVNANLTSTGGNIQLNAMDVQLGANVIVNSDSCAGECAVEFNADTVAFDSTARVKAGLSGANGVVSFVPRNPGRLMQFTDVAGRDSGRLSLTPWELGSLQTNEVNIGSSASTGAFDWLWPGGYPGAYIKTMVIETAGMININNGLQMQDAGTIILRNYGGGSINIGSSGSLDAGNIFLRSDSMSIAGSVGTSSTSRISIDSANASTIISLANEISAGDLTIDAAELTKLHTSNLEFGSDNHTGAVIVQGDTHYDPGTGGSVTLNGGTGQVSVNAPLSVGGINSTLKIKSQGSSISQFANAPISAAKLWLEGSPVSNVSFNLSTADNTIGILEGLNVGDLSFWSSSGYTVGLNGLAATPNAEATMQLMSLTKVSVAGAFNAGNGFAHLNAPVIEVGLPLNGAGVSSGTSNASVSGDAVYIAGNFAGSKLTVSNGASLVGKTEVAILADNVQLENGAHIAASSSSGVTTVSPYSTNQKIALGAGASDSSDTLGLSEAELRAIDSYIIGLAEYEDGEAGAITVVGSLDLTSLSRLDHIAINPGSAGFKINAGAAVRTTKNFIIHEGGPVIVDGLLESLSGNVAMDDVTSVETGSAGLIRAQRGSFITHGAIGTTAAAPLNTRLQELFAQTDVAGAPFYIVNNAGAPGALAVYSAVQYGDHGDVSLINYGAMDVVDIGDMATVKTGTGKINLETHSPLTVHGLIKMTAGELTLTAGDGGALSASGPGRIEAGSATVALNGGTIDVPATVIATSGTVTRSQTVTPPPPPPPAPTVAECLAKPAGTGCGAVLAAAKQACIANPTGPDCGALLPPLDLCKAQPSTEGCSAVLPKIAECIATPSKDGCTAVLPNAATCAAHPDTLGCTVVNACLANPNAPGCGGLLPTIGACVTDKTLPGCDAVLPKLEQCRLTPNAQGCSVVLPAFALCKLQPSTPGCDAVLPSIDVCIGDKARDGCSAVLPQIGQCVIDKTMKGCAVVLPSLAECVATPGGAGCAVVLPSIATCTAQPATSGCQAVLPRLEQCIADPTRAGCVAVLPKIEACVAEPTRQGCSVILPTLAECVSAPTLQGCQVVLPTVAECAANPNRAGCKAVIPSADICTVAPNSALCQVLSPPSGATGKAPVDAPVLALLNNGAPTGQPSIGKPGDKTSDKSNDKPADKTGSGSIGGSSPTANNEGGRDARAKTYCN